MSSNNGEIGEEHFTQTNGTAFGGQTLQVLLTSLIIDPRTETGVTIWADWRRYRATHGIKKLGSQLRSSILVIDLGQLEVINTWYPIYAPIQKMHKALDPRLCPSKRVTVGMPLLVALRVKRNFSVRVKSDRLSLERLGHYKGYLLDCGCHGEKVDKAFLRCPK